jgi:hemerythrin-like domain-containing protein
MTAVEILLEEHRLIERVLDALETAADHLDRGHPVRAGFFLEAAEFIAGFADGCHHQKEEGVLFGAMIAGGAPAAGGPIDMMLDEHEQARALTRQLRDGAKRLEGLDAGAAPLIVRAARRYVALLRDHIAKEDEMLFPMADELLSPDQQEAILKGFGRIEHSDAESGLRERFLVLAQRLEREAAALVAT